MSIKTVDVTASKYYKLGMVLTRLKYKSKDYDCKKGEGIPIVENEDDIDCWWGENNPGAYNIGFMNGRSHDGSPFVDVDLDCPISRKLAPHFLPPTATFGRPGAPQSHYIYRVQDLPETARKITCKNVFPEIVKDKRELLELRVNPGDMTVLPPSTHRETGEHIAWTKDPFEFKEVEWDDLVACWKRLAIATIIAYCWGEGSRSDFAGALAGWLLKAGWDGDNILHLVKTVAEVAGDDEIDNRVNYATRTIALYHDGGARSVKGAPAIKSIVGQSAFNQLIILVGKDDLMMGGDYLSRAQAIILNSEYADVRFDVITNKVVMPDGSAMTDSAVFKVRRLIISQMKHKISDSDVNQLLREIAEKNKFDPLVEMLEELPPWDGKPWDDWLVRHLGVEDTKLNRLISRKWLIAAIARAYEPGCHQRNVLVLQGPQAIGKTLILKALAGASDPTDDPRFYISMAGKRITDRYTKIELAPKWIAEFADLGELPKSHTNDIKAFISDSCDDIKLPFDKHGTQFKRRVVLVVTENPTGAGWNNDPTGHTRWWPVECKGKLNLEVFKADRPQILAGAIAAYKAGEKWWLTDADEPEAVASLNERQNDMQPDNEWEQFVDATVDFWKEKGWKHIRVDHVFDFNNVLVQNRKQHFPTIVKILTKMLGKQKSCRFETGKESKVAKGFEIPNGEKTAPYMFTKVNMIDSAYDESDGNVIRGVF